MGRSWTSPDPGTGCPCGPPGGGPPTAAAPRTAVRRPPGPLSLSSRRPRSPHGRPGRRRRRRPVPDGDADRLLLRRGPHHRRVVLGRLLDVVAADHRHDRAGVPEMPAHPLDVLADVPVRVGEPLLRPVRPVGHGQPDVVEVAQLPPREVRPVGGVQHVGDHRRQHDRAELDVRQRGPQLPRQVDQRRVPGRELDRVGELDVHGDRVEPVPVDAEGRDLLQPPQVTGDVAEARQVPGDHLHPARVGPDQELAEDVGAEQPREPGVVRRGLQVDGADPRVGHRVERRRGHQRLRTGELAGEPVPRQPRADPRVRRGFGDRLGRGRGRRRQARQARSVEGSDGAEVTSAVGRSPRGSPTGSAPRTARSTARGRSASSTTPARSLRPSSVRARAHDRILAVRGACG